MISIPPNLRPVDSTFELGVSLSIEQGSIKTMSSLQEPLQTFPNLSLKLKILNTDIKQNN